MCVNMIIYILSFAIIPCHGFFFLSPTAQEGGGGPVRLRCHGGRRYVAPESEYISSRLAKLILSTAPLERTRDDEML